MINICVAICTYKRPSILETLTSLAAQKLPKNITFDVVVADNDATTIAQEYIENIAKRLKIALTYVHAPARNISIARNACLAHCAADWLAYIDDDEVACENWLAELYQTAIQNNADVVFGPVKSIYSASASAWIKEGDFHSHEPIFVNGVIETGYSGNTLCRLNSNIFKNELFDLSLGRSGGEDTDYFSRAFKAGATLTFSEKAVAVEPVPEDRASLAWLVKRRFCIGQTYVSTVVNSESSKVQVAIFGIKAFLKLSICMLMTLVFIWHPIKKYRWLIRGCLHLGVITKLLGKKNMDQY